MLSGSISFWNVNSTTCILDLLWIWLTLRGR